MRATATRRRALVLNQGYQPIHTVSIRRAVTLAVNEAAVFVLPPNDEINVWQELTWDDWAKLRPREGEDCLKSVRDVFKIPEILKLCDYNDNPARRVKLSRRAIHRRDDYTCQYCGKRPPQDEITIDHVLPKAQGGRTLWDNVVLACVACNRYKDNRTPEQARMRLLTQPRMPQYDPLQGRNIRVDSWQHFLGDCYWEVPLKD